MTTPSIHSLLFESPSHYNLVETGFYHLRRITIVFSALCATFLAWSIIPGLTAGVGFSVVTISAGFCAYESREHLQQTDHPVKQILFALAGVVTTVACALFGIICLGLIVSSIYQVSLVILSLGTGYLFGNYVISHNCAAICAKFREQEKNYWKIAGQALSILWTLPICIISPMLFSSNVSLVILTALGTSITSASQKALTTIPPKKS